MFLKVIWHSLMALLSTNQGAFTPLMLGRAKFFQWDKNGRFKNSFGKKGQGPGELQYPTCITAVGDQIWVTDSIQKLHVFFQDGTFQKSYPLGMGVRVLKAAGNQHAILGARALNPRDGRNEMAFSLLDLNTGKVTRLKAWENQTVINIENGAWRWQAFGADVDVQNDEQGRPIFGFSQDKQLYTLNQKNQVAPLSQA